MFAPVGQPQIWCSHANIIKGRERVPAALSTEAGEGETLRMIRSRRLERVLGRVVVAKFGCAGRGRFIDRSVFTLTLRPHRS